MNDIEHADICIVGGSIAGNYLSYLLSNTGLKISIIEEHEDIGHPLQCTGIISKKLARLIEFPDEIILNRVKIARLVTPSGNSIELSGKEEPYIIDRVALDRLFYEKIKNNNTITYHLGEKFKSFVRLKENADNRIVIETSKRKISARVLIGCDGPLSSVGKKCGIKNKVIYGTQIRIKGNFNHNKAHMYFDLRWKEFFAWVVPEGNDTFRIGLASEKFPARNMNLFLNKLGIEYSGKINQQGGIIPIGTMNKAAFKNVILLGDAACQVKATTGGGIVMLLHSAKIAARCLIKCFKGNNFSKKFLRRYYQKQCLTSIGRQLKIHYLIRIIFECFSEEDYEKFFQILKNNKVEQLISFYGDMDFPKQVVIKLLKDINVLQFMFSVIRKNPRLIFKVLKALVK